MEGIEQLEKRVRQLEERFERLEKKLEGKLEPPSALSVGALEWIKVVKKIPFHEYARLPEEERTNLLEEYLREAKEQAKHMHKQK